MSDPLAATFEGSELPKEPETQNLCKTCRAIDFKRFLILDNDLLTGEAEQPKNLDLGYLDALIRRSSSCLLCSLLVESAKRLNYGQMPPVEYEGKQVTVSIYREFVCNTYDEKDDIQAGSKTVDFYRAIFHFHPAIFGHYSQVRFQLSTRQDDQLGVGRRIKPVIDIDLLKRWLGVCEVEHGKECHTPSWLGDQRHPQFLRVIDVKKHCIMHAPSKCRYITLSYVWGNREEMISRVWLSTKANQHSFEEEGGLDVKTLPKTISDAMELVSKMGERYLWVDALCIMQDDEIELAQQTAHMDMVYANALFTVIAASGTNAEAGLLGLHSGTRSALQGSINIDDKYCLIQTVAQGNTTHLQQSTWNSRGWTFQERLLSRRVLIFTPEQVFWNCESGVYCEEVALETDFKKIFVLRQALDCHDRWDDNMERFSRRSFETYVSQYSLKNFTYENDVLAAFSGILRRMEYENMELYHWGLPHTRFDLALCWQHGAEPREACCRVIAKDGSVHQVPFPTWSWLGWKGFAAGPRYNDIVHARTVDGTSQSELQFYKIGLNNNFQLIQDPTPNSSVPKSFIQRSAFPLYFPLREKWKGPTLIDRTSTSGPFIDTGCLAFYTSHASLLTRIPSSVSDTLGRKIRIHVSIKGKEIDAYSSGQVERLVEKQIERPDEKILLNYIVVSRHVDVLGVEKNILNLLVVLWDEQEKERNVARRIGTAEINEEDWVGADREWKLVILV